MANPSIHFRLTVSEFSVRLEAKEPLLVQLKEPWSYIMTGSLDGVYTLQTLPTPSSSQVEDGRSARRIPNFLRRS